MHDFKLQRHGYTVRYYQSGTMVPITRRGGLIALIWRGHKLLGGLLSGHGRGRLEQQSRLSVSGLIGGINHGTVSNCYAAAI